MADGRWQIQVMQSQRKFAQAAQIPRDSSTARQSRSRNRGSFRSRNCSQAASDLVYCSAKNTKTRGCGSILRTTGPLQKAEIGKVESRNQGLRGGWLFVYFVVWPKTCFTRRGYEFPCNSFILVYQPSIRPACMARAASVIPRTISVQSPIFQILLCQNLKHPLQTKGYRRESAIAKG
jgi:hypothetical protein